ncbi:hypothetical protein B0I35DRAFT_454671 [Stachybotrys elegans]|uniref:Uncharacterized protein n=1 Tax=Stachybotrys elegans TaxID=80388 RepID=A0A8K0SA98_9HYPO|nr:hypothetical protein B0I35DRAFT_454671 [Stachybotrys elegans]
MALNSITGDGFLQAREPLESQKGLENSSSTSTFFSLNISIYNQQIVPEDWSGQWFSMAGCVHPYALTWEIKQSSKPQSSADDSLENDDLVTYTIASLIVRDFSYQPISPRTISINDRFPTISPTIRFLDSIISSGQTLLQKDSTLANLSEPQLKCCGFYPFSVFIIFPIYLNPWASLCKRMAKRQDTQFQANGLLSYTGKVAGLLDYRLMVQPPAFQREDYVFIVSFTPSNLVALSATTTPTDSIFTTARQNVILSTPISSASLTPTLTQTLPTQTPSPVATIAAKPCLNIPRAIPTAVPTPKRPYHAQDLTPSSKRPRQLVPQQASSTMLYLVESNSSTNSNAAPFISTLGGSVHESEMDFDRASPNATSLAKPLMPAVHPGIPQPALDSIKASPTEPIGRPHQSRVPTKKYEDKVNP